MKKTGVVLLAVLACLAGTGAAFAQATSAFNGRVVDQGGAVIPGATVTATNTSTGVARTATTNGDGLYSVTALTPGVYDVKAENAGFAASENKGVTLVTSTTLTLDFTLGIAGVTQQVEVTSQAPMIETTQSQVSSDLQQSEVQQLPMLNRSISAMLALTPSAREAPNSGFSVAHNYVTMGGSNQGAITLVDGIDDHDDNDGGTAMSYTLEGIQEFKLLAHDFSAEYGKTGQGVVVMATKSGANQVHGSAFGYGRSDSLTKIDYFSDPAHGGFGKPPYSREQYGGSLGGPFHKDRAWYAGSIERISQQYFNPIPGTIYDDAVLVANAFPSIGAIPLHSDPQPYRDLMVNVKTNFQLTQKHTAFVRYSQQANFVNNALIQPTTGYDGKTTLDKDNFHTWTASLGETWVISPTTINQFTWEYMDFNHRDVFTDCANLGLDWATCTQQKLVFADVATGVDILAGVQWFTDLEKRAEFKDDFSKQIGKHAIKFGDDFAFMPEYGGIIASPTPGEVDVPLAPSAILANPSLYPEGLLTPGLEEFILIGAQNSFANFNSGATKENGVYFQDDIKVTPRLTINAGIRHDIFWFMNQNSSLPLADNRTYQILKTIGNPFGNVPQTSAHDFQPRIGVAWDVSGNGKTVIRAGYGIFAESPIMNSFFQQNEQEKPTIFSSSTYLNPLYFGGVGTPALASYVLGTALPASTPIPSAATSLPSNSEGYWYNPALTDGREQHTGIGLSHSFSAATIFSFDYTHIQGTHEWGVEDINPVCTTAFQGPCISPGFTGPVAAAGERPLSTALAQDFGNPNALAQVQITTSDHRSHYDELVFHFEHRMNKATFQANYIYARAMGWGGSVGGYTQEDGGTFPQIPNAYGGCVFCPGEYGPGANDERHRVTASGVFKLPFGLEASPTFTAASARPYTLYVGANPDGDGGPAASFTGGGGLRYGTSGTGTPGPEVSFDSQRGAPLVILSTRVTRSFKFRETKELDGFAEFFNLTNRPNFGNIYGAYSSVPTEFKQPVGYLGGQGASSTIPNSFQMQLGARFSF